MFPGNVSKVTMLMIYLGTLLISILSFFTTYRGMNIILSWELALLGSLGLQTAMLGIAWNLIKIKDNRASYVMAFSAAALFSVFFSYANFDTNLKANTRPIEARNSYYEAARPVLSEYTATAKNAGMIASYQVDRLGSLITMEQERGWATVIDEGSQDPFLQSIIDGARRTVESWRQSTGSDYRQGKGRVIIVNYLESRLQQANNNYYRINQYITYVDSLSLALQSEMTVEKQNEIINQAYVAFPTGVVDLVKSGSASANLSAPPMPTEYAEKPSNTQQALMMVIGDLYIMDKLSFLSLLLAFAIDFIVIAIAFAGSHIMAKTDLLFERIEGDAMKRMKNLKVDDVEGLNKFLDTSLHAYKKAAQYGKDLDKIVEDYNTAKIRLQELNKRNLSTEHEDSGLQPIIVKERSQLDKWLKFGKQRKAESIDA
jgi:hypothetical protein